MIHSGIPTSPLPQISWEKILHPERSPHLHTHYIITHKHYSQTDLCGKKKNYFLGGINPPTDDLPPRRLISAGVILLELFYTYQQTETKGKSCQNDCEVFAERAADCPASLAPSCRSNTTISERAGRHGSRPKNEELLGPELHRAASKHTNRLNLRKVQLQKLVGIRHGCGLHHRRRRLWAGRASRCLTTARGAD